MKTEQNKYQLIKSLCNVEIIHNKKTLDRLLKKIEQTAMFFHVPLRKPKQPEQRQFKDYIILIADNTRGMQTILPELYFKVKNLQNQ